MTSVFWMDVLKPFVFSPMYAGVFYFAIKELGGALKLSIIKRSGWKVWGLLTLFFLSATLGYKYHFFFNFPNSFVEFAVSSGLLGLVWSFILMGLVKEGKKPANHVKLLSLWLTLSGVAFLFFVIIQ